MACKVLIHFPHLEAPAPEGTRFASGPLWHSNIRVTCVSYEEDIVRVNN
jgi:hypothetical protein